LSVAKRANAHFSDDLLSSLLNEPIAGNGIFWSSTKEKPIPIPVRVMSFESTYRPLDGDYTRKGVSTYARQLKDKFDATIAGGDVRKPEQPQKEPVKPEDVGDADALVTELEDEGDIDVLEIHSARAIEGFRNDHQTLERIRKNGLPWRGVLEALKRHLPDILDDRDQFAHNLVTRAMDDVFGQQGVKWDTQKREKKSGPGFTTWIVLK
jgi:hypothetical protein